MHAFTEEQRAFLLQGTRTGKLGTVRRDGRAYVVPIWFTLDGDTIVFITGEHTVKMDNLRRSACVCICVDEEMPPYAHIVIEGMASWHTDPQALLRWATCIGGRYMGEEWAEEYSRHNGVSGELLVRVTPTRVRFEKEVAG